MKKILEIMNALSKVQTVTLSEKLVKEAGMMAIYNCIDELYPDFRYQYDVKKSRFVESKEFAQG